MEKSRNALKKVEAPSIAVLHEFKLIVNICRMLCVTFAILPERKKIKEIICVNIFIEVSRARATKADNTKDKRKKNNNPKVREKMQKKLKCI